MFTSKFAELLIFGFAPLMLGIATLPFGASAEERKLAGTITYDQRMALPDQAVVTVELSDVSLGDTPATIVAKQQIERPGQVPIKFSLAYDPAVIRSGTKYALHARITVDNQLWFTNKDRQEVDPLSAEPIELKLTSAR